ncbi:MAG: hypothetical protein M3071_22405 [Actinomycetota bacterium]|nr:hypothetical protein [Actinomycetota bacterium]
MSGKGPWWRKVCVVVASRANLAWITTVLEHVREHPALALQVIASSVGAARAFRQRR